MKASSYDLILMDMRMPNMDGLEATRKIRALGGHAENVPIIALTANAFDDDRNACFDSGMNDFMTKPVSAEELTEMVNNWINKTRDKVETKVAV
jgi:CheY-like chemotaxis protein